MLLDMSEQQWPLLTEGVHIIFSTYRREIWYAGMLGITTAHSEPAYANSLREQHKIAVESQLQKQNRQGVLISIFYFYAVA